MLKKSQPLKVGFLFRGVQWGFPSSGKMAQAEGKDKFIRLCLGEACLNESIRFRKGMKNLGLYVPVFCGSLADFIGSAARTDQNGSSRPKPNQQLPSLGL